MRLLPVLSVLLLAAAPARAERAAPDAKPPAEAQPRTPDPARLSQEDEELVQELALLEQLELVKNLELFEEDKPDPNPPPQR